MNKIWDVECGDCDSKKRVKSQSREVVVIGKDVVCKECSGRGYVEGYEECDNCGGSGRVRRLIVSEKIA